MVVALRVFSERSAAGLDGLPPVSMCRTIPNLLRPAGSKVTAAFTDGHLIHLNAYWMKHQSHAERRSILDRLIQKKQSNQMFTRRALLVARP